MPSRLKALEWTTTCGPSLSIRSSQLEPWSSSWDSSVVGELASLSPALVHYGSYVDVTHQFISFRMIVIFEFSEIVLLTVFIVRLHGCISLKQIYN